LSGAALSAEESHQLDTFKRQQLTDEYYSEGVNAGDINRDGHPDVVHGPYWYEGPSFEQKHEIYPPKPQPRARYADNFFSWVYDFNGDGWNDIFVVGFPGTPAHVYENPGSEGLKAHWKKHQVFDWVSNESPHFTNLVGDEKPELVCTRDGFYGYCTFDPQRPFEAWEFHPISEKVAATRFGHGLGVGDINNDDRLDVLCSNGWYQQPADLEASQRWRFHEVPFARGGAEMYAYDVDGDGDSDVITSLSAHDFGLAWHEQIREGDAITFRRHLIMGDLPEKNRYGLVFSEPHSVNLADIDGDGLKDIITGKTYWSHHKQSPMWDAGAVVYWFRLVRGPDGVDWVPYQADGESGIGRQIIIHDVNGDALPDIVVGGMKGAHVLLHQREAVDQQQWQEAQPKKYEGSSTLLERGPASKIDPKTGSVAHAQEGEDLKVIKATGGNTRIQEMANFKLDRWSGGKQLFWTGARPGDQLELEFTLDEPGDYRIEIVLTMAGDYGIVQPALDDRPLGKPLDLYNSPDVLTSGVLTLDAGELSAGEHRLKLEITGAHPAAKKAYLVGLDYLRPVRK
jgi:hypothetical protein